MKNPVIGSRFLFASLAAFCLVAALSATASAQRVRLRSKITPTCGSGTQKFSDIYGEGNIAVMGSFSCTGAFIFDITNPDAPVLAAHYNPTSPTRSFLEAIVVGNRGYFGSGTTDGVHIVDLTNPYNPVFLGKVNSTSGNGHNTIHEMAVFQQNGATYLVENSNNTSNKILKFINVTNPAAPVFIRDLNPTEPGWVHAMMIKGNRMITSGWGFTGLARTEIYDISNIGTQAPQLLGFITDPNGVSAGNNNHSAWLSEDGNYLYSAREISGAAANGPNAGDIRVFDVSTPSAPVLMNRVTMTDLGLNAVTPHNPVVMGNKLYVSWYQAGLQVFDISTPTKLTHIGQYDTFQSQFTTDELVETERQPWDVFCGRDSFGASVPTGFNGLWAVFPFLGEDRVLIGDLATGLYIVDVSGATAPAKNVVSDFDGDGKTDFSTFTPASGNWHIEASSNGAVSDTGFGLAGDVITPGDYDGDGRSDLSIFRPSTATWWFRYSSNPSAFYAIQFGTATDIPVAADYDADGRTDIAVWRPSTGVWYIMQSTLGIRILQWGMNGDKPVMGDFDGDGKIDMAVWRPSNGVWYIMRSSSSIPMFGYWGLNGDKPVAGDFDGNGITDLTVYRPSDGTWYILDPLTGAFSGYRWGLAEDMPIPADFDGDAKADVTIFRPSNNAWYRINSSNGGMDIRVFGQAGDKPSPSSVQPQ